MIKFNGLSEKELGVVIEEPTRILGRAPLKTEITTIDGRDSNIVDYLGYEPFKTSLDFQILDINKIDLLFETLTGKLRLDYDGKYSFINTYDAINLERMAFLRKFSISVHRDPFWRIDDDFVEDFSNTGNVASKPILRFVKKENSSLDVTVSGIRFKYTFNEQDTYVDIDCESKNAMYDGLSRNRNLEIGWDFPIFHPGENVVTIHSGDALILCKRKDLWL